MTDIEHWERPENLGLRLEEDATLSIAKRGGIAALLAGAAVWTAGAIDWPGPLDFLEALDSLQGRLGSALLLASGLVALVVARLRFGDEF